MRAFPSSLVSITAKGNRKFLKYFPVILFMALSSAPCVHFCSRNNPFRELFSATSSTYESPCISLKACNRTLKLKEFKTKQTGLPWQHWLPAGGTVFFWASQRWWEVKRTLDTRWNLDFRVQVANKKFAAMQMLLSGLGENCLPVKRQNVPVTPTSPVILWFSWD